VISYNLRAERACEEFVQALLGRTPSGLYRLKQYWYSVAPYGADVDDR
jgi:hypothetical protein